MNLTITMKKVAALNPCESRFENFKEHYPNFNGDFTEFLDLTEITHSDKLWVVLRLIPYELVEIFAVDCAVNAVTYSTNIIPYTNAIYVNSIYAASNAAYTAYASNNYTINSAIAAAAAASNTTAYDYAADITCPDAVANYAIDAAANAYSAAYTNATYAAYERTRQIEALIWLIQMHTGKK